MASPDPPHWAQPSHPDIQHVVRGAAFATKSQSTVAVAPFGVYAALTFPPCALVDEPSYATVQVARDRHVLLNSDLLYMNHSCEPSLVSSVPIVSVSWTLKQA